MNITEVAGLNDVERFDAEFKGKPFWFEALKHSLTPQFLQRCYDADKQPLELARALADVITAWSVCSDDKGTVWPLTVFDISRLPIDFLNVFVSRIAESWAGNEQTPGQSANGSAASAK